jgi:hypothetical protein
MSPPDPIAIPHNSSIHNLPLDANPHTFYSLPIFDTNWHFPPFRSQFESAVIALSVTVRSRSPNPSRISHSAQHPTQLPLTEVSTLLD